MGVNEVDGMTDMDERECVIECEMDECESRGGVGGWVGVCGVCFEECGEWFCSLVSVFVNSHQDVFIPCFVLMSFSQPTMAQWEGCAN